MVYYDSQNREIEDSEMDAMRRDRLEEQQELGEELIFEPWQMEVLHKLLQTKVKEVDEITHITTTIEYGQRLHHLITNRCDCIQIDQVDVDEKYQQRIKLFAEEQAAILKTLLLWYFKEHEPKKKVDDNFLANDALGDLDDPPF